MNKQNILLVVVVALLAGGLVFAGSWLTQKPIIVDNQGRPIGAIPSALDMGIETGQNGLKTVVLSGSFKNSTTTIVYFDIPTNFVPSTASATLEFLQLKMTGRATTTFDLYCGPTLATTRNTLLYRFMNVGQIGTSTHFGIITNNTATSSPTVQFGSDGTRAVVLGGGNFSCVAEVPTGHTDVTFANNSTSFSGTWIARILYQR